MRFSSDSSGRIKGPLGDSSLEDWHCFLENSPSEATPPLSRVSRLELIVLSLRTAPGLVVISILWIAFLLALVFASILLTSWATQAAVSSANSTAASRLASASDGSTGRKPFSCLSPQCDDWKNTFEAGRSSLNFEILIEGVSHAT